jgi:nucleotide-binding universal stress UspA family protein
MRAQPAGVRGPGGAGRLPGMKTIVVGYDGTDPGKRALERTELLARTFAARVVIVCVAEVLPAAAAAGAIAPIASAVGAIAIADEATSYCDELTEEARQFFASHGIEATVRTETGSAGMMIVAAAGEEGADLIVTGTRDSGLLERFLGGSVSQTVAKNAPCDVLIVR